MRPASPEGERTAAQAQRANETKAWVGVACLSFSALAAFLLATREPPRPREAPPPPLPAALDGCAETFAPPDSARKGDLPILATRPTKILAFGGDRYVDVRGDMYTTAAGPFANLPGPREGAPRPTRPAYEVERELCGSRAYLGTLRRADTERLAAALDNGRRCDDDEPECHGIDVLRRTEGDRVTYEVVDERTPEGRAATAIFRTLYEL